ncbi:MAG: hypothetical protein HQL12_01805 [Candidatus Omnitrophica bacterium]|nr:hypothetical protein [Candidatus Omnitrophota bacterium]
MKVLLILHSEQDPGAGLIVAVKERSTKDRVLALLEENREREAFDLLKKKAVPQMYLAPGQKPREAIVTLIEDDLR